MIDLMVYSEGLARSVTGSESETTYSHVPRLTVVAVDHRVIDPR